MTGAARQVTDQRIDPNDGLAAVTLAIDLINHGIPVVVCQPNPHWSPGAACADLIPPKGWAVITAEECRPRLADYRPGVSTLAMVGGHGVDAVDVDPKAGGSVDNMPGFRHYGVHLTPSGGKHYLVRSTGVAKISPLTTSAGHVGDYIGGTAQGASRALLYLPGSARPKYPCATYDIEHLVHLDLLLDEEPDHELIAALEGAGGRRTGSPGRPAMRLAEVEDFLASHAAPSEPACLYGRNVSKGLLAEMEAAVPGDPVRGRHGTTVKVTVRCVELVQGAPARGTWRPSGTPCTRSSPRAMTSTGCWPGRSPTPTARWSAALTGRPPTAMARPTEPGSTGFSDSSAVGWTATSTTSCSRSPSPSRRPRPTASRCGA